MKDKIVRNILLRVISRNVGLVPLTLSLFVSWFSALSVLGDTAEAYYYGSVYWYLFLGHGLCMVTTLYFAPKYQALKLTSAYEVREKYAQTTRSTLNITKH